MEGALLRIAAGESGTLEVARLADIAGSLSELVRLLDWLNQRDATLIARDVVLDTSTAQGHRTVALLREIERWERPRGRPGVKQADPALAERIGQLRDRGYSLHAIARALNDEGVPTPRGGLHWRSSSVQAALGYRRPPPPPPGAPQPPRHRRHPPRRHPPR